MTDSEKLNEILRILRDLHCWLKPEVVKQIEYQERQFELRRINQQPPREG